MKTKKQIEKQIEKLKEQLEQIETEENVIVIKFKDKTFKIIKWAKQIKDFPIPKGFRMSEHSEFIKLLDSKKLEILKYPNIFFTKNYSKINIKKGLVLSRVFADDGGLLSYDDILRDSNDDGWVVVVK